MATTDLQSTTNLLNRVLAKIKLESKTSAIAKLAVIVAVIGLIISSLISVSAWSDAKTAKAKVDYELEATRTEITVLKIRMESEAAMTHVYLQENYILMKTIGLNPNPPPEIK